MSKWELLKMSRQNEVLFFFLRAASWKGFFLLFRRCIPWNHLLTTSTFWSRWWYSVGFSIYQYKTDMVSLQLLKEILNVNPGILAGMWKKILSFTKVAQFWMVQHPCSLCNYFYEALQRKTGSIWRVLLHWFCLGQNLAPTQRLTDFHSIDSTYSQDVNRAIQRT